LLTEKEDWQAAAEAFTQATIFVPDEPWYYQDLGDALTELGDWAGAAAAYEKVNK
jgi:Flp pilus assembly protein TadD